MWAPNHPPGTHLPSRLIKHRDRRLARMHVKTDPTNTVSHVGASYVGCGLSRRGLHPRARAHSPPIRGCRPSLTHRSNNSPYGLKRETARGRRRAGLALLVRRYPGRGTPRPTSRGQLGRSHPFRESPRTARSRQRRFPANRRTGSRSRRRVGQGRVATRRSPSLCRSVALRQRADLNVSRARAVQLTGRR